MGWSSPCFSCCWSVMGLMAAHGAEEGVGICHYWATYPKE